MKITTQEELNDLIATANVTNTIVVKEDLEIQQSLYFILLKTKKS